MSARRTVDELIAVIPVPGPKIRASVSQWGLRCERPTASSAPCRDMVRKSLTSGPTKGPTAVGATPNSEGNFNGYSGSMFNMNPKPIGLAVIGVIVALLGTLWVVQGLGLIEIRPILCFADCEPITGGSLQWTVIGAIALFVGVAIARAGLSRSNR